MDTASGIPVLGKELQQNPRPDDAVAWEPNTRQWLTYDELVAYLERQEGRQRGKFGKSGGAERVRGAHFAGAAAAKLLASVNRKGAEDRMLKNPIDVGDALQEAKKGLPEYAEILKEEAAAIKAALAGEEEDGPVPDDETLGDGTEQDDEGPGKKRVA